MVMLLNPSLNSLAEHGSALHIVPVCKARFLLPAKAHKIQPQHTLCQAGGSPATPEQVVVAFVLPMIGGQKPVPLHMPWPPSWWTHSFTWS